MMKNYLHIVKQRNALACQCKQLNIPWAVSYIYTDKVAYQLYTYMW